MLASQEGEGTHVDFDQLTNYKDFVKGFAVDIFIANWDVAGSGDITGNLIIDNKGNVTRIDPGGALSFRARGAKKRDSFDNTVGEYDSMRDEDKSQVAKTYNTHSKMIIESFKRFLEIPWNTMHMELIKFNRINIVDPINELIEDSELKMDILEEWHNEFEEILGKLQNRYASMKQIFSKLQRN